MSELKPTTIYDAYWKANSTGEGTGILVYLKSEADKVIAEKDSEIRRLKRALYKACANWAHFAVAFFSSYAIKEKWRKMEQRCLKKEKEYK